MKKQVIALMVMILLTVFFLGCDQNLNFIQDVSSSADRAAAAPASPLPKIIKDVGVIRYINLEGGFFRITGRTGNYNPINLPREFQRDGLNVQFTAEILNAYSINMWGIPVRLISIQTTGTVRKLIMDTGIMHQKFIQGQPWIIEASTGSYQPLNLPREFMVEDLNVLFVGIIRTDIFIIPALWPVVELIRIEKLSTDPLIVNLKEEFKLPVGKSASIPSAKILFTFKSVLQDSRCPRGVECFWEGEAIILVNVVIGDVNYGDFRVSTRSISNIITAGGYSFQLNNLLPYPVYGQEIDPDSYVGYFIIYPAMSVSTDS